MTRELIEQRDSLQAQLDQLELKADITVLESTLRQHAEQQSLIEAWGDYIDPMETMRADPDFFGTPMGSHQARPDDRKYGDNAPIFTQEQTLALIRGSGEYIAQTDPTAIGALETLASYVIGKGFVWQAESDDDPAAAEIVQRVVEEFCERVRWCGNLDRELFKRTRRSGERFVRIVRTPGGYCDVDIYEPSWVMQPQNADEVEHHWGLPHGLDWKYGIATEEGFATRVFGYSAFRHGDPDAFEFVPVEDMSHVKINVDRGVKRGITDFYVAEEWLGGAAKLLRRTIDGGSIQASIALIREWNQGASNQKIESAKDGLIQYQSKLLNRNNGTGYENVPTEKFYSGKTVDVKGAKYHPGPMGSSNAPTFINIVQAGLRKAANRWSMPEFMFTGDASNANYASTLVSESPFVKFCEFLQKQTDQHDADVMWRVVKHAADSGRTEGYSFLELKALVTLAAQKPDVAVRNRKEEHDIRSDQHAAGLLSRETWAAQSDLDYEDERQKIEAEPPVAPPAPMLPTQPVDAKTAALQGALESVETTAEARAILESMR